MAGPLVYYGPYNNMFKRTHAWHIIKMHFYLFIFLLQLLLLFLLQEVLKCFKGVRSF
jgi:hypothetical protein